MAETGANCVSEPGRLQARFRPIVTGDQIAARPDDAGRGRRRETRGPPLREHADIPVIREDGRFDCGLVDFTPARAFCNSQPSIHTTPSVRWALGYERASVSGASRYRRACEAASAEEPDNKGRSSGWINTSEALSAPLSTPLRLTAIRS
jgi:hypothetical protein